MRFALLTLALLALMRGSLHAAEPAKSPRQPNIVFLFADDVRHDLLGAAGHPVLKTPQLDRLAREGVRFENMFVTTPVCWVSRAVVLTGQWARSHSVPDDMPRVQSAALENAYPLQLRAAGYRTAFFGKWHLRPQGNVGPAKFFDEQEAIGRNPYLKPQPDGATRHEAQLITDRALDFIGRQSGERPFCLNLWFNSAHAEDNDHRPGHHYQWPATVDGMYDDLTIAPPRLNDPKIFASQPEFIQRSLNRERFFWGYDTAEKYQANLKAYYRMISGLDHEVGRIVAALAVQKLADNTIIVYSADNGYYLGNRGFQGKWSHYDESLRVPLVIYDPRAPQAARGAVRKEFALNVDLPSTFVAWAGGTPPASYQGRSLAPLVEGQSVDNWRHEFFCEHLDLSPSLVWEGIRSERYMYARYVHQQPAYEFLHDLSADPDELVNLASNGSASNSSSVVAALDAMRRSCNAARDRLGPEIPQPNKPRKN